MHQFIPPVVRRSYGDHPLFGRLKWRVGTTVLKQGDFYRNVEMPETEDVDTADAAYIGGHVYKVSDAEAAALTEAGYGEGLSPL